MSTELVTRLAARGDGVTESGRYVAGAVPGDRVRFEADRAVIADAGPHRRTPPCRHFPACGGCQLQHVDDAAYGEWVAERILFALAAQSVPVMAVEPAHLSPPRSRRRASLRAARQGRGVRLGFNATASHDIIDMAECHILDPALFALIEPLRGLLASLIPAGQAAGVTLTASDNGADVLLSNVERRSLEAAQALSHFAHRHRLARLSIEDANGVDVVAELAPPVVRFGDVPVVLPPAPFLQATRDGEAALQRAVLAAAGGARQVADLFCGLGTFALPLAERAAVHAVDASGPAIKALEAAAKGASRRLSVEHRDLFRRPLTARELARFDAVLFDPPRAGAREQTAELARSSVNCLIAVSCNPNTLARDASLLAKAGFKAQRLWPIGQFRWSIHVEAVLLLTR